MNPDSYMPYYGNDFDGATKGLRREVKFSYLSACWHYWHQTHCSGIPNDDEYLRLVCECPEGEWVRTKGLIFGRLFHLEDGKWHQKRARKIYAEATRIYQNRVAVAAKARAARHDSDSDTSSNISSDVNSDVNADTNAEAEPDVSSNIEPQPKPKPKQDPKQEQEQYPKPWISASAVTPGSSKAPPVPVAPAPDGAPRQGSFKKPTRQEAEVYAAKLLFPVSELDKFLDHYEANGWKVGRVPMKDWQAAMRNWLKNYNAQTYRPAARPTPPPAKSLLSKAVDEAVSAVEYSENLFT